MLRKLGADVVGMSVIHEAISACYLGMNVTACSLVTNTLSDTNTKVLTHNDVLEIAEKSKYSIFNYFKSALSSI
jgi:purine-nucleoside phosphorylase